MKKFLTISAILLALLLTLCFAACTGEKEPDPTEAPATEVPATEEPTPEPTDEPPTEFDASLAGDWYGVFSVNDAGGKFKDNAGKANDCAARFALGENGVGPFYCVINGMGDGFFSGCEAAADTAGVTVTGTLAGEPIAWRYDLLGGKLLLSAIFGSGDDYMLFDMTLRHCGDDWSADSIRPAGFSYTAKYGFYGVVEQMGGSRQNVPELTGEGVNTRLTDDAMQVIVPAFDDEGRTISANGQFSIILPESFAVTEDGPVFAIESEEEKVRISYELYDSDNTPMEELMNLMHTAGYNDLYHYVIDGYDCYAVICTFEAERDIVIAGQKDDGRMLLIDVSGKAMENAHAILELDIDYMQAVFGLLVNDN